MEISTSTNICAFTPGRERNGFDFCIAQCAQGGYKVLDINFCESMNPHSRMRNDDWQDYVKDIAEMGRRWGVVFRQSHLPYYDIFAENDEEKVKTMEELIRISGLSHGTDVWIGNAQEIIKAGIAPLASCICCRDDIMNALIDYGVAPKMSFDTMESVRKGRGLKPEMEEAMIEHNVPTWFIDSCKKIKYMFPKGHAVAYVTMALRIAWYKVHRPAAYYCAYYTVRADCFDASILGGTQEAIRGRYKEMEENSKDLTQKDKDLMIIMELVIEMLCRGIKLAPVDLYKSDATKFQVVDEKTIRMPFNALPGLGEAAAQSIVDAREQSPFISIEDLRNRTKISASLIDLLREGGCLGGLPESNQTTLFSF